MGYILAVIMVTTVGITQIENTSKAFQEEVHPLFKTLDLSMMTVFRCLTGDCSTSTGLPLILLLTGEYGVLFVIFWVATVMLVTFGLYNLIMAIYIEDTLATAKSQAESAKARRREAIRVAETTKKLVAKFCRAQLLIQTGKEISVYNVGSILKDRSQNRNIKRHVLACSSKFTCAEAHGRSGPSSFS